MRFNSISAVSLFLVLAGLVAAFAFSAFSGPAGAQESPAACENGVAVPNPSSHPGLVADCTALLGFSTANVNWSADRPITEWTGLTISGNPRRVTRIILGADSKNPGSLSGSIPAGIGELTGLKVLSLRGNGLSGAIPAELAALSNLRRLYLSGNALSGCVPPDLRGIRFNDLSSLQLADCTAAPPEEPEPPELACANGIAVPNPDDNPKLVADCETLLGIKGPLAGTRLNWSSQLAIGSWEGIIVSGDPLRVTGFVYNREYVDGQYVNQSLNGSRLPAQLGNLDALERLELRSQRLTGSLPAALGDLANLRILDLSWGGLSGPIPPELGQLTQLEHLDLRTNELTGSLPPELGGLASLQYLSLGSNDLMSGSFPSEWTGMVSLEEIWLPDGISGCIPSSMAEGVDTRRAPEICNVAPRFRARPVILRRSIGDSASPGAALSHAVTAPPQRTYSVWGGSTYEDDILTYSLSSDTSDPANADAASFTIDPRSGVLSVGPDTDLDYDQQSSYTIVVQVSDGKNRYHEPDPSVDDSVTVIIDVIDEVDPAAPSSPGALTPALTVTVSWAAATGRVTGYEVQYRVEGRQPSAPWIDHPRSGGLGTSTQFTGLASNTNYTIRVRAVGPGGSSGWTELSLTTGG